MKDTYTKANVYCSECKQFQCDECMNAHTVYDVMDGHTIVTIEKAKLAKVKVDMKSMDYCKVHKKEIRKYCFTHEVTCCSKCHDKDHK